MTTLSPTPLQLPAPAPLLSRGGWSAFFAALIAVCAVAPVLNLWVPAGSAFHLSDYAVALLGKIMCYAICALAMDLIWGYTGILSLGHGLFFALGGYVMGMYLMRQAAGPDALPPFMVPVIKLNPLYHYINCMRCLVMYGTVPGPNTWIACIGSAVVMMGVGLAAFRKLQRNFILYL